MQNIFALACRVSTAVLYAPCVYNTTLNSFSDLYICGIIQCISNQGTRSAIIGLQRVRSYKHGM